MTQPVAYDRARFLPGGDKSIFIEFGNAISPEINYRVWNMLAAIQQEGIPGVTEVFPTYRSLLLYYNPLRTGFKELREKLEALEQSSREREFSKPRLIEIPMVYGGKHGPDLEFVAKHNNLSVEEVVAIHAGTDYLVYMLGFTPGFVYLGEISEEIATPRVETPQAKIPDGSVGIGGRQTGIYSIESPGGWRLIGRTPLKLFDPGRELLMLLQAGDYVRFVRITLEEFVKIKEEVKQGTYQVKKSLMK